jgi:hypothetical protein
MVGVWAMFFKVFAFVTISGLSSWVALAKPHVTLKVHPKSIEPGELTSILLEMQDVDPGDVDFKLPNEFQIRGKNQSKAFSMSFGSGTQSKTTHRYQVQVDEAGDYEIGPFSYRSEGKEYKTNSEKLTVVSGGGRGSHAQGPQSGNAQSPSKSSFFLEAQLSQTELYVNQRALLKLRLFYNSAISEVRFAGEAPKFVKFWDGSQITQNQTQEERNGISYRVLEIWRGVSLTRDGETQLPPIKLTFETIQSSQDVEEDEDFFGSGPSLFNTMFKQKVTKTISSNPVDIQVKALPQPSPEGFTGVVGKLDLKQNLNNSELLTGSNGEFTLEIMGDGDLSLSPPLEFGNSPSVKLYVTQPTSSLEINPQSGVTERKKWNVSVVPLTPGEVNLPSFKFVYFDTQMQQYNELVLGGQKLKVNGSALTSSQELKLNSSVEKKSGVSLYSIPELLVPPKGFSWSVWRSRLLPPIFILGLLMVLGMANTYGPGWIEKLSAKKPSSTPDSLIRECLRVGEDLLISGDVHKISKWAQQLLIAIYLKKQFKNTVASEVDFFDVEKWATQVHVNDEKKQPFFESLKQLLLLYHAPYKGVANSAGLNRELIQNLKKSFSL